MDGNFIAVLLFFIAVQHLNNNELKSKLISSYRSLNGEPPVSILSVSDADGEIVGGVTVLVELPIVDTVERRATPSGAVGVHRHDVSIVIVDTGGELGRAIVGAGSLSLRLRASNGGGFES
jgi:hypothetical protein